MVEPLLGVGEVRHSLKGGMVCFSAGKEGGGWGNACDMYFSPMLPLWEKGWPTDYGTSFWRLIEIVA